MTEEGEIQRDIINHLEENNWMVWRLNAGKGRKNQRLCPAGTPDLMCVKKGVMIWVEVKTPTGKVSEIQADMHEKLGINGQHVIVARSLQELKDSVCLIEKSKKQ